MKQALHLANAIRENLSVSGSGWIIGDLFSDEIVIDLKKPGLVFLNTEFNSSFQKMLDLMNKRAATGPNTSVADLSAKHGIGTDRFWRM